MSFFFFKQKTAYEMRISDWSSDVCSSDLEAQVLVQAVADVVTIEQVGVLAHRQQLLFRQVGDGGLARAGQAGEPDAARLLMLDARARGLVDIDMLPVDVAGAAPCEIQRAGGDRGVALAIDQDERTERLAAGRSEARRVRKECVSKCRSRWSTET